MLRVIPDGQFRLYRASRFLSTETNLTKCVWLSGMTLVNFLFTAVGASEIFISHATGDEFWYADFASCVQHQCSLFFRTSSCFIRCWSICVSWTIFVYVIKSPGFFLLFLYSNQGAAGCWYKLWWHWASLCWICVRYDFFYVTSNHSIVTQFQTESKKACLYQRLLKSNLG